MSALPPNWTRYTTDDGKEYFHNAVTNTTQWDQPEWSGARLPETMSFDESSTSQVYQYKPELDLGGSSGLDHQMADLNLNNTPAGTIDPVGMAAGGAIPSMEADTVSLNAPGGTMSSFGGSFGGAVGGVISAATADDGGAAASGMMGSLLNYAQQLFDVSTDDVVKRLKLSLVPYPMPDGTNSDFRQRPDFWGPFWVATTAVFFLAATGNFARLLEQGDSGKFKADYGLVSWAAAMIYGALLAVPAVTRASLYFSGQEANSVNFRQMICVYGYSLAPAIPVSVLCLLPFGALRWLLIFAGLALSLVFIRGNLWTDISVEAPSLKWTMIGMVILAQTTIFFIYRVHFFAAQEST